MTGRVLGMLLAIAFTAMLAVLLVVIVMRWQRAQNPQPLSPGQASKFVQGSFTVTGVSNRPDQGDSNGERFCTISGTITGEQTHPTEVYGTLTLGEFDPWPQIGADLPVLYKPNKAATSWRFGVLPPAEGPQQF